MKIYITLATLIKTTHTAAVQAMSVIRADVRAHAPETTIGFLYASLFIIIFSIGPVDELYTGNIANETVTFRPRSA